MTAVAPHSVVPRPFPPVHRPDMVGRLLTVGWARPLEKQARAAWPSELSRRIRAGRPHKPRCRPSGRFSRRSAASPPPAPGSPGQGGHNVGHIRIRPTQVDRTQKEVRAS